MLVLNQCCAISGESSFFQIRKHVEQVHRGHELDDGVAQELETFVVSDLRLGLASLAETRHDTEETKTLQGQSQGNSRANFARKTRNERQKKIALISNVLYNDY
jgi:hypothetical protein